MLIRIETSNDYYENEKLTREAFWDVYNPGCDEHLVLHNLRKSVYFVPELCFVAEEKGKLIGNIVYAKLVYNGQMADSLLGFGPLSVDPKHQNTGIGSKLITFSLLKAKEMGAKAVLITGNPAYYTRFGFVPASEYGLHLKGVPVEDKAEFFMALELEQGALRQAGGIIDFAPAYYDVADIDSFDSRFPPKSKRPPRESDL